jgi:hypothetical protein
MKRQERQQEDPEEKKDRINKQMQDAREALRSMIKLYLDNTPRTDRKQNELEVRFGTKSNKPISKTDYDNVVKQLKSAGFYSRNESGEQLLRIRPEFKNPKTGENMISNIRAELTGIHIIEKYCETNDIKVIISKFKNGINFTQKMSEKNKDDSYVKKIDFTDMNFRVSYDIESNYSTGSPTIQKILDTWGDSKKIFRYMNRVRFRHDQYPILADLSIIRSSNSRRGFKGYEIPVPEYTIQKANVFKNPVQYEIEFEIDNTRVGPGTEYNRNVELLIADLKKCIRVVMSGLQGSNYPIPNSEREALLKTYENIIYSRKDEKEKDEKEKDEKEKDEKEKTGGGKQEQNIKKNRLLFIGPSSVPLQVENIIENPDKSTIPNIRTHYTVTDKADGERMLMVINEEGLIYFLDKNMRVVFTGSKTAEKSCFNSILDGEYIKYGKANRVLNLYAAFDIYFINKKSVREKAFIPETEEYEGFYRLPLLTEFIKKLKPSSVLPENNKGRFWKEQVTKKGETAWINIKTGEITKVQPPELKFANCVLNVKCKKFYSDSIIFNGCQKILNTEADGGFQYNIDGLIFTPSNTGVGSNKAGEAADYAKSTWNLSFKWKPSHFNTVDFLVSTVKDKSGKDKISHNLQEGSGIIENITQYKTLELRCGFDKEKHIFTNPFNSMVMGHFPKFENSQAEEKKDYVPMLFVPSNPYQSDAGYTNIRLIPNGDDNIMMTEEGEYFEEDTIVEFRYDISRDPEWRWVPLRVRYDKTQKMQSGKSEYGNAYHVANDIWKSYYNPVTEEMIKTGQNIPEAVDTLDIYYNKSTDESKTKALRNFHNLYVKNKLILSAANREDILIDYAVGKAGDLHKWAQAKLGFVFGIDIANDNIINIVDGACARYLNEYKRNDNIPGAIFLNGNSAKNIRDGSAFSTEQNKKIIKAVFGQGPKDKSILGQGIYNQYDVASDGFNISSCQFAVHYFFENLVILHGFLRNLAECTRLQGYFIGTCYDGRTVFNLLKDIKEDESVSFNTNPKIKGLDKICEITKKYSDSGFPDDELSVGYAIDVFQETINKTFREFLVNFEFFQRSLENYGFTLLSKAEAVQLGLPNSTGLFSELYEHMQEEIKQDSRKKANYRDALKMSDGEKSLSFMNRYFIFRKTTSVNAAQIEREALKKIKMVNLDEEVVDFEEQFEQERTKKAVTGRIRKLKAKIILSKGKTPLEIREEVDENVLDLPFIEPSDDSEENIVLEEEDEKREADEKRQEEEPSEFTEFEKELRKTPESESDKKQKSAKEEKPEILEKPEIFTIRTKKPKAKKQQETNK